jgi:outer membrane protein TolC
MLLICFPEIFSQQANKISVFDLSRDIEEQLPPLDTLMLIAHERSPMVLKFAATSRAEQEKISLQKKTWTNHIQIFGNYSTGNQGAIITGTTVSDINSYATGWRAGVNLSVPIYEFVSRSSRIRLAKAEYQSATYQTAEAIQLVDMDIITLYEKLLFAHKQVRNNLEFAEKARINEELAGIQLRENQTKLADYTRISEIRALADNRLTESQSLFLEVYNKLELMLGVTLISIKR